MGSESITRLEEVACPLGCPEDDELVLQARDRLHEVPGIFSLCRCRHCGLMRTNPRPGPESIGAYYPGTYGPYQSTRVSSARSPLIQALRRGLKRLSGLLFDLKTQSLPILQPGRMLEIGCASGAFLHKMAAQGWQVQGVEYSSEAASAAAKLGYQVHAGSLENAPAPSEPYDLVVGWMVLEHLHDPLACLRKLRAWSRPGAWLAISVPNAASFEFRLFRDRWYALQLPTHLLHFTPDTLARLLEAGGWRLEKVRHQRVLSNFIASLGYVLQDAGLPRCGRYLSKLPGRVFWLSYLLYPLAWLLSLGGQTGRMTVWARAKE